MGEMLIVGLLLSYNSWKLTDQRMVDVSTLVNDGCQQLSNLGVIEVFVNVLSIKFSENGFPKFLALEIQPCSRSGDMSKWEGILDGEYVDIFDGDGDDDRVHGIIDLNIVVRDVFKEWSNMSVKKILDVVLDNW